MLSIIAHHYMINSGLTEADVIFADPLSFKSLFLLLFGMWGKTGINCFVLITGYFMCTSNITFKKFLKLLLEVCFYNITIYLVFLLSGYQKFSPMELTEAVLPIKEIGKNFTGCYILFYLFIPFLNILIRSMTEKQHIQLIALCSFTYVVLGTIPIITMTVNYISWFIVIYFIASYIRLYPKKWFDSVKITGWSTLLLVVASMCSVVATEWFSVKIGLGGKGVFWFVADSYKILAVLTAVSAFCFFKNIKIKNSKFINTVAASTFGVLCIHANSNTMRRWLWKDTLNNVGMFSSNLIYIHAFASIIGIFIICTMIDLLRRKLLEEPFFKWFDRKMETMKEE